MPRTTASILLLSTSLAAALAASCVDVPPLPDPVVGYQWCLDAEPATGSRLDNFSLTEITHPVSGLWMRGCRCYCPDEHDIMVAGANGQLAPDSPDDLFYQTQVSLLRADALLACTERLIEMQQQFGVPISFADPDTISCADAVADEDPYYATECPLDTALCPAEADATGGATDDTTDTAGAAPRPGMGGPTVYGLEDWSEVIHCATPRDCAIEAAFVDALLQDLGLLADDAIRVLPGATSTLGHHGFQFTTLGPQSLAAALGLHQGDLLWQLGGIELRDVEAVTEAFEQLHQATTLIARIDRDGRTLVHTVRIVAALDPTR